PEAGHSAAHDLTTGGRWILNPSAYQALSCEKRGTGSIQPMTNGNCFSARLLVFQLNPHRGIVIVENHKAHAVKTRGSLNRAQPQIGVARPQDRNQNGDMAPRFNHHSSVIHRSSLPPFSVLWPSSLHSFSLHALSLRLAWN